MTTASFTGEYPQRIDGKGRVSIPADFRRVLERGDPDWTDGLAPKLQLLYGDHLGPKLEVWTGAAFRIIEAEITARRPRNAEEKHAKDVATYCYLTQSTPLEVDKEGRIVVPARQRGKIGLVEGGEVVLAGGGDRFAIWSAGAYESEMGAKVRAHLAQQPEGFDPMTLIWSLGA